MARQYTDMPPADATLLEKLKFNWTHRNDADRLADNNKGRYAAYIGLAVLFIGYNGYNLLNRPNSSGNLVQRAQAQPANAGAALCTNLAALDTVAQLKSKEADYALVGFQAVQPRFTDAGGRMTPEGYATCMVTFTFLSPTELYMERMVPTARAEGLALAKKLRDDPEAAERVRLTMGQQGVDQALNYGGRSQQLINYTVEPMGGDNIRVTLGQ